MLKMQYFIDSLNALRLKCWQRFGVIFPQGKMDALQMGGIDIIHLLHECYHIQYTAKEKR